VTAALGHTAILLAFVAALAGIASPLIAARFEAERFRAVARYSIFSQFSLVTVAALALIYGLVATDFSIKYVAFNTTRATPIYYRVTGLWGALEGSLLLWEWILIIFAGIVAWVYRNRHHEMMPWVVMIFSIVSAFFPWRHRFPVQSF
jgi:cytochrome c-type biogenesis protein CcmF